MIQTITYDLNTPGKDYTKLIEQIKAIGDSWAHPCESFWLIKTSLSAQQVYDRLCPYIDSNDRLLVSRFSETDRQGWLSKEVWNWINDNSSYSSYLRA